MKKKVLLSLVCSCMLNAQIENLSTMVVSAQKTEQNVFDVPISMTVLDDIGLEDSQIDTLNDLMYFVPGFYILDIGGFGATAPSIRGVSTDATTLISSVGLYVDGVPTTGSMGFMRLLNDVERVEVLRGPQGTLYGKNAQAGVVNIITKKPTNKFEGSIGLAYGEDNKKELEVSIQTPLIKDKFFMGLSGRYYEKDGFFKNTITNKFDNYKKNYFGKLYLRATPTDRLEVSLISSLYQEDSGAIPLNLLTAKNFREYQSDIAGYVKFSDKSNALKISYDFDNFKLDSTTVYKQMRDKRLGDNDYTNKTIFHALINMPYKTISEELKISGEMNRLKWVGGVYVDKTTKKGGYEAISADPKNEGIFNSNLEEKSLGIFSHFDYALSDKLSAIAGIRYDKDKRRMQDFAFKYDDSAQYSEVSPKFALNYKINPNFMTYASIAKGYKSGGFYMYAANKYPKKFKKETLWNYEVGFKSIAMDGKLNLTGDIYYMNIEDMQVLSAVDLQSGYLSNAASARSYGFEMSANYMFNNHFSTFANFSYNNSKFDKFKDAKGVYSKNYTQYSPKYTYSIGGKFRGYGGFYVSADMAGYGKMYLDKANTNSKKAYEIINAKIGYEWKNFDIYLYGKNIFDKNYDMVGYWGRYVMLSDPREIGVKFTYRF